MKKIIKKMLALPDDLYNWFIFKRIKPEYTQRPRINGKIHMFSSKGAISFGNDVRINSSLKSNPIGGSTKTILYAQPGGKIKIGDHVGISNSCIFAANSVTIGNNVLIGGDCRIYDTDFHSVEYVHRISENDQNIGIAPVEIEDGAFIGTHTIILKGVKIGKKSVIAAGSVVTKSVPAGELWGGVPARFIRKIEE